MANHKSAEKAHIQSLKRAARNRGNLTRSKTFVKKVDAAIQSGDKNAITSTFRMAESMIMKCVTKGVLKINTAARQVSKLSKRVKSAILGKAS
jgi:small subunit ribosomal protein S20